MDWVQPPENSVVSLQQGIQKFDGVEFDLRLTKDNEVIIHHDALVSVNEEVRSSLESPWVENNDLDSLRGLGFASFAEFLAKSDVSRRLIEEAAMICIELKPPHPSSGAGGSWFGGGASSREQMGKLMTAAERKLEENSIPINNSIYYSFFNGFPQIASKAEITRPVSTLWPIIPRFGSRSVQRAICLPQYVSTSLSRLLKRQRRNNSPMVPCALEYFIPPTNHLPIGRSVGLEGEGLKKLRKITGGFPIYVWPGRVNLESRLVNAGLTPLTDNADPGLVTLPCGKVRWDKPATTPLTEEWLDKFSNSDNSIHADLLRQAQSELTPWHEMNKTEQEVVVGNWRKRYEWKKSMDELLSDCTQTSMPWEAVRLIGHRGCGKTPRPIF